MKTYRLFQAFLAGLSILIVGLAGCEVDSASSSTQAEILVSPASANIEKGQAIEFTATGWTDYTWTLSERTWGTLSRKTGNRTVYTAVAKTSGVQVLTCSSAISATSGASVVTTEALITHY